MDRLSNAIVELEELAQQKEREADEIYRKMIADATYRNIEPSEKVISLYDYQRSMELISEAIGIRTAISKILNTRNKTKNHGRDSAFS